MPKHLYVNGHYLGDVDSIEEHAITANLYIEITENPHVHTPEPEVTVHGDDGVQDRLLRNPDMLNRVNNALDNLDNAEPVKVEQRGPGPADLDNRFDYHRPKDDATIAAHEGVREACRTLAHHIVNNVPAGREQSTALTKVEEAMLWANAGIARHEQ